MRADDSKETVAITTPHPAAAANNHPQNNQQNAQSNHQHGSSQNQNMKIPPEFLDELFTRFLSDEDERKNSDRLLFAIEQAHWHYLDFLAAVETKDKSGSNFPKFSFRKFTVIVLQNFSFLIDELRSKNRKLDDETQGMNNEDFAGHIILKFQEYKRQVPTYGAILIDTTLSYCLLVRGVNARVSWGFPKGKRNKEESPEDCAIREVYEEIGFDCKKYIQTNKTPYLDIGAQQTIRLYLVSGIDMNNAHFEPNCRNEIRDIKWFNIFELPDEKKEDDGAVCNYLELTSSSFYMAIPFVSPLRRWCMIEKKKSNTRHRTIKRLEDAVKKVANWEEVRDKLYEMNNCIRKSEKHKDINPVDTKNGGNTTKMVKNVSDLFNNFNLDPQIGHNKFHNHNMSSPKKSNVVNFNSGNNISGTNQIQEIISSRISPKSDSFKKSSQNSISPNYNSVSQINADPDLYPPLTGVSPLDKICNDRKDKYRQKLTSGEDMRVKSDYNGSLLTWLQNSENQYPTPEKFCFKAGAWNQPNIFDLTLSKQQCLTLSLNNTYEDSRRTEAKVDSRVQAWSHESERQWRDSQKRSKHLSVSNPWNGAAEESNAGFKTLAL